MNYIIFTVIAVLLFYIYIISKKKIYIWLPSYIVWSIKNRGKVLEKKSSKPIHVLFFVADHFEPGANTQIVERWVKEYPKIANRHHDADGRPVKHTWFYPSEKAEERMEQLIMLSKLCAMDLGEIELHLHHQNDTEESLRLKLKKAKEVYNKIGALISIDGSINFGFVHGDWALDNSVIENGQNKCGVNNELSVLKDEGCYADFTFPAINSQAQPRKINSIYYAIDDPLNRKSYDTGIDVSIGSLPNDRDLMIIQGPLTVDFRNWRRILYPAIENGGIEGKRFPCTSRIRDWIRANIHVKGKSEWIFIKVHTHGAASSSMEMFLGEPMEKIYSQLESEYNDGKKYLLHYVTAREAYNIIKAAEGGMNGNPDKYRNFLIKPYKNSVVA